MAVRGVARLRGQSGSDSLRRHYPHQVQGVVLFALCLRQHSPTLGLIASLISAERFNTRKRRTSQPSGSPATPHDSAASDQ